MSRPRKRRLNDPLAAPGRPAVTSVEPLTISKTVE